MEIVFSDLVKENHVLLGATASLERYINEVTKLDSLRVVIEGPFVVTLYIELDNKFILNVMESNQDIVLLKKISNRIDSLDVDTEYRSLIYLSHGKEQDEELYQMVESDILLLRRVKKGLDKHIIELGKI